MFSNNMMCHHKGFTKAQSIRENIGSRQKVVGYHRHISESSCFICKQLKIVYTSKELARNHLKLQMGGGNMNFPLNSIQLQLTNMIGKHGPNNICELANYKIKLHP